jgi:hypothetical protein
MARSRAHWLDRLSARARLAHLREVLEVQREATGAGAKASDSRYFCGFRGGDPETALTETLDRSGDEVVTPSRNIDF